MIFPSVIYKRFHCTAESASDVGEGCDGQGTNVGKEPTCKVINPESGETLEVAISLPSEELLQGVLREMWRYSHAYQISNSVSTYTFVLGLSPLSPLLPLS